MKKDDIQKELLDNRIRMKMNNGKSPLFSEEENSRFHMSKEGRIVFALGIFTVLGLVMSILCVTDVLSQNFSLSLTLHYILRRVSDFVDLFSGNKTQSAVHYYSLQFVCVVLTGMALSLAGTCFQSIFQNPMASPTMLGVQSGGALGSLVYLTFFYTPMLSPLLSTGDSDYYEALSTEYLAMTYFQKFGQYFFTFLGCIAVVIIIMLMAKVAGRGKIATVPLMVGGTVFSGFISKILSSVQYYATLTGDATLAEEVKSMRAGAFEAIWDPEMFLGFAITIVPPLILAMIGTTRLNVLTYGEEEAKALGVSVASSRVYYIIVSTMLTASVIAFCGNIAFVGMVVPHFARFFVGNDFRHLVPASAFMGALLMLLAWDISYMVRFNVNCGAVVSSLGSFAFLIFMIIYRRRGNADWA